jgi:hypothetical protein
MSICLIRFLIGDVITIDHMWILSLNWGILIECDHLGNFFFHRVEFVWSEKDK